MAAKKRAKPLSAEFTAADDEIVRRKVAQICAGKPRSIVDDCTSRVRIAILQKRMAHETITNLEAFTHETARRALADIVKNRDGRKLADEISHDFTRSDVRAAIAADLSDPEVRAKYKNRKWGQTLGDEEADFEWLTHDEYNRRIVSQFYERVAWLSLEELHKKYDGDGPGQGEISRSLALWRMGEAPWSVEIVNHVPPSFVAQTRRQQVERYVRSRQLQTVSVAQTRGFRAAVIRRWRFPQRFELNPMRDGSYPELGAVDLTYVSLMLGARPIELHPKDDEGVTLLDLFAGEFENIKKALQRAKTTTK